MKTLAALLLGFFGLACMAPAAEPVDYVREIKPILLKNCSACHGPEKQRASLRLDSAAGALKGGNSGPAIMPGKSGESLLIKAVTGADDVKQMPPKEPRLDAKQIGLLKAWIDQGAKAPATELAGGAKSSHWAFQLVVRPKKPAVRKANWVRNPIDRFILARLEKEGIAPSPEADRYTLIRRLSLDLLGLPPTVEEVEAFLLDNRPDAYERLVDRLLQSPHFGERWGRHWLDAARYADSHGFTIDGPRPMWNYRDWVIDAFNHDLPFDQFTIAQIAGDLLDPPLPPAGASQGPASPKGAAGSILPPETWDRQRLDRLVATGFHRNTLRNEEGGIDLEQFRVESVVDRVNTTGSVFLGLTVGCCQCHNHKFDPISQREYYQFFAFLNNADEPTLELISPEQKRRRDQVRAQLADWQKRRKSLDFTTAADQLKWEERAMTPAVRNQFPPAIMAILEIPENARSPAQKQVLTTVFRQIDMTRHAVGGLGNPLPFPAVAHAGALKFRIDAEKRIAELKASEPEVATTLIVQERKSPRPTHVHIQGDFTRKGAPVSPGVPSVLHPLPASPAGANAPGSPNRLDLAKWLVDPKNPLTPRVTVNRFWQHCFGVGLVETENDFGTQGTPPTHPELLDWLASEFVNQKWGMKAMIRQIVTSATYRQSSRARPELAVVDPRNRLLARQNRLRLEAEVVRDVALASSGLLNPKVGGPSVFPPQPEGVYAFTQINKNWKAATGPDRYRRGLYTYFWRSAPHPGLTVFDAPDANSTCTRRNRSNTPLQALTLLNDQAFVEFAQGLAVRVLREPKQTDSQRLRRAFQFCLARPPSEFELKRLGDLLAEQRVGFQSAPQDIKPLVTPGLMKGVEGAQSAAWTVVARVLLNLDEFITRE